MRFLAVLLLVLTVSACDQKPASESGHKETLYVFGTLVEFTIYGVGTEEARVAVAAVDREFQHMHRDWHAWKPGALTDLNRAIAHGRPVEVDDFLLAPILKARELWALSGGLFDPAIGKLVGLWGFHADERPQGAPPDFAEIARLVAARPSMGDLRIDGHTVVSANPEVQLDFGGFGKGMALDRAIAILRERGVEHAVVNAGGDLNSLGLAEGNRPWRAAIRHPRHWGVVASVELTGDEVLHTSGNYERFREHEGIRYAHIIDPRTGMPVEHIASASVIHHDGALADAAATALAVAGPREWEAVARDMGIRLALLIDEHGTAYATADMAARVTFIDGSVALQPQ